MSWCNVILVAFIGFVCVECSQPRNLYNFQTMIKYSTQRSAWDYNNYGRWCGFGGSGEPVDDVDRCCQIHDWCYDDLNLKECKGMMSLKTYYVIYKWDWYNETEIICNDNQDNCSKALCECDKAGAECFSQSEYNKENSHSLIDPLLDKIKPQEWWDNIRNSTWMETASSWIQNWSWWG